MDGDAFLRSAGADWIDRVGHGDHAPEHPQVTGGLPYARVVPSLVRPRSRCGGHNFPDGRRAKAGFLDDQFVEKRGTAARHSGDEDGRADGRGILKQSVVLALDFETGLENALQMSPHEEPAKRVEVRFGFEAPHKDRKRGLDGRTAEVFEAGFAPCACTQFLAVQPP